MAEADTTLEQKTSELEAALSETRGELARVDAAQRTDVHRDLVAICGEASEWLAQVPQTPPADEAASLTQKAEAFLRELRLRRDAV
jgi:hypothetical protein